MGLSPEGYGGGFAAGRVKKAAPYEGGALLFQRSCLFKNEGRSEPLNYLPV